jgi:hypothetical protein
MPTQVKEVYGYPSNASLWGRIDHCLFNNPRIIYELSEIVTDAQWCMDKCAKRESYCWGVNVVPLKAPSTATVFPQPNGTVWSYPQIFGADIYVPWGYNYSTGPDRGLLWVLQPPASIREQLMANDSKYICYAVEPADFTDNSDEYEVSKDPADPVFYSTCYYLHQGNMFPGYENSTNTTVTESPWRFYGKCIDCEAQTRNLDPDALPTWQIADPCINCDLEPKPAPAPAPEPILVETGYRCDPVHHNCPTNSCLIYLAPIGRGSTDSVYLDECQVLVARNPNCSNTFQWMGSLGPWNSCYCYSNAPCCLGTCSPISYPADSIYELTTTPDPTCSTGVLSADGKSCCSGSCGAGNCVSCTRSTQPGFCCTNAITRPCSQNSPPCLMD